MFRLSVVMDAAIRPVRFGAVACAICSTSSIRRAVHRKIMPPGSDMAVMAEP
jgi:hypothetical protein